MTRIISLAVLLLVAGTSHATTWARVEKTDPLSGEKVPAYGIMSYGSYIYHWPSKYDLVFWPLTAEQWICLNPKNGYAAFNNDFEKLSTEEKEKLRKWLKKNYKPSKAPKSHREKLAWLERVYRQRKMDDEFWSRFYRLMAYVHRGDKKTSMAYVKKAIPLLQKKLERDPKGVDRIATLYLLGEYSRRTGRKKEAKDYFEQVRKAKYKDRDGKEKTGHPYFLGLVRDREKLLRGEQDAKGSGGARQ